MAGCRADLRFIFYKLVHVYTPALEAASPTVFIVWLLTYMTVASEHCELAYRNVQ